MSISGSGRGAFKRSVWQDWTRVIGVVSAGRGRLRPRRVFWRPRVKVLGMVGPTGAAIGWLKNWVLVSRAWAVSGANLVFSPIGSVSTWPAMTPEFEEKAADIIGLYLQPPANAAVFCVDEKSAIQALDRLDPVLPLSPGRAERHGFEYFRHGTLSLYAALNTRTGDVLGKTAPRHTSAEFIDFLSQIVASQPEGREIHIVVDNLSAHKTKYVFEFLQANPSLRIHYTPTSSSWLNQVEIWFSKIRRDVISRGIFTSTTDLSRKLIRYIKQYNKTATPFRWRFKNAAYRIKPVTQRASDSAH